MADMEFVKNKRVLLVEHERATPGGLIEQWFIEHSAQLKHFRIDLEANEVPNPRDFDLIVSLGSEFAAYDDSVSFVPKEIDLYKKALGATTPIFGVCFGGQLLARVIGGDVYKSNQAEIGWLPVRTLDPEIVSEGPWFQWHFDTFRLPREARLMAETDVGPQVFSVKGGIGLQFHPEVTPTIMKGWVESYPHELRQEGVDPQRLLEETDRQNASNMANAERLIRQCVLKLLSEKND